MFLNENANKKKGAAALTHGKGKSKSKQGKVATNGSVEALARVGRPAASNAMMRRKGKE